MAKSNYTRKMFLIDMLNGELTAEQRECATAWLASLEKKANAPKVNKTRLANEQLAQAVIAAMVANADTDINAKWISENVAGIATASKAVAVVKVAIENGLIEKYQAKGRTYYRLTR